MLIQIEGVGDTHVTPGCHTGFIHSVLGSKARGVRLPLRVYGFFARLQPTAVK